MKAWSQEEAFAFECAREAITALMAIFTTRIVSETGEDGAAEARRFSLRAERSRLAVERDALRLDAHDAIARIRTEYGAAVQAWREENQASFTSFS